MENFKAESLIHKTEQAGARQMERTRFFCERSEAGVVEAMTVVCCAEEEEEERYVSAGSRHFMTMFLKFWASYRL